MIRIENIHVRIRKKELLQALSATFETQKINLILGPNGAGKSTLIKVISGELVATKGTVFYENVALGTFTPRELAKKRAVLSQHVNLAFPLKVEEVVLMGRYPHFESKARSIDFEICQKAMALFELTELANRNFLTLSGGEKQRVQFARIFAQISYGHSTEHHFLILDEPLNSLDIYHQYEFMKIIQNLLKTNPLTVIGVLHDLNLTAKFADYILLLDRGRSVANGNAATVITPENIKKVFKMDLDVLKSTF